MKKTISRDKLPGYADKSDKHFPTYVSGLINTANRYGQGTVPKRVGQMTEEFKVFCKDKDNPTLDEWEQSYYANHKDTIKKASDAAFQKLKKILTAGNRIKKKDVENWIRDLVITKTFNGLYLQREILKDIARTKKETFRESSTEDEAKGIDGYVGDVAYSVKPVSYRRQEHIVEDIQATMVYYKMGKKELEYVIEE